MRGGAICIPQPNSRDPRAAGSCGTRHPGLSLPTGAVPEWDKPSPRRLLGGVAPFAPQPSAGYIPPHRQGSSKPPSPGDGAPPARPHAASCFLCTFLFCKHHLPARLVFAGVIRQVLFGVTAFAALLGHVQQPCPEPSRMRPPLPSRSPPPQSPVLCRSIAEPAGLLQVDVATGAGRAGDVLPVRHSPAWLPTAEVGGLGARVGSPVLPSPPWCGTGSMEECEGRATPGKCSEPEPQPPSRSEQRP